MSPKLAALAAWLAVTAFFGGIGGYHIVPQLIYLRELAKSNHETKGEIIETYPQMHSTCKYRSFVNGQFYEHTGRSCGNDRVGQQIAVYFSPADPNKSINEYPAALFVNDLIPFVLALVLFPIFAAIVVYQRARHGTLWSVVPPGRGPGG
jgi:Protein of unknown function (DUF3592)